MALDSFKPSPTEPKLISAFDMTAADAVVHFSNQAKHLLSGIRKKSGLNIDMHDRPNNLGTSFLTNTGINHASQTCVSGDPEQVRDQLRQLVRSNARFDVATALFETHEADDPGELAMLLHDLTPGGLTFVADYAMEGLDPKTADALTQSEAERRLKMKKGTDEWLRIHARYSQLDMGKWLTEAGFANSLLLALANRRVFGIGVGSEFELKPAEYEAALRMAQPALGDNRKREGSLR